MGKVIFQVFVLVCFFLPACAQESFDFYLSNKGNDSYPGTSKLLPKKTIAALDPLLQKFSINNGMVRVGFKSGDVFEESLAPSYPLQLNTYTNNNSKNDFAILDGSKEFSTGWIKESGSINTFKQAIPYTGFVGYGINGIGSYSFIYVLEIDKQLEKTAPFTARKLLKFVSVLADVDKIPGSFYIPVNTNENPIPVLIHTSDGSSPNSNTTYRYEVTVRDWAVNSTYQENNHFENLWIRGFGAGNGMMPGGANSYYNRIIFGPGASVHHLVLRSGTINHSLFLPGPRNTNGYAVVFYDTEGFGRHCTIKNSMFLDIRLPLYAHTSLGTNYGAVEVDHVFAFADSTETSGFMYTSNTDSVLLNNVYTDGYTAGYYYGNAKYASIRNSWFKDVNFGIGYSAMNPVASLVDNVFIKTTGTPFSSGIIMQENTSLKLTNSIVHLFNTNAAGGTGKTGAFLAGSSGIGKVSASGNIFICETHPSKSVTAAITNTTHGMGTSTDKWNNNVYILLKGDKILWGAVNDSALGVTRDIYDFDEWKKQSGQDQNSLFFDLRHDRRGLKAIFTDPENGNYNLAATAEGNLVAALGAGMTDPINCFLQRPTYEKAAALISANQVLSVNECRNPCRQNKLLINPSFRINTLNTRQINLQWNIPEQQNINHYEIQRSTGYLLFQTIKSIRVSKDTSYSFDDDVQPGIEYNYRLMIVPGAGGRCYSDVVTAKIKDDHDITIFPNPSGGKILVTMNGYIGRALLTVSNVIAQPVLVKETVSLFRPVELDCTMLPKGMYFLKVETGEGSTIHKVVLQ